MADVQHKDIVDPNIHEPKGVAYASAGSVYTADGSGSGSWEAAVTSSATNRVVYTASGSWTAPEGVTSIGVWVVGRGGSAASDGGVNLRPQGGGGGGAAWKRYTDIVPGTSYSFTIDSSKSQFRDMYATVGANGSRVASASLSAAPGTGTGGDINIQGGYGHTTNFSSTPNYGGGGGSGAGPWGGSGGPGSPTSSAVGGCNYGGGGGGSVGGSGGAGGSGAVIIEW